jgi:hypothetical protein
MENVALATVPPAVMTYPEAWALIERMAPIMAKSGIFGGQKRPEEIAAKMLKGYDMGMSPTASLELVQVINGQASLSPKGALAILHNSPKIKQPIILTQITDTAGVFVGFECTMTRTNGFTHTVRFTLEEAKHAGLVKPGSGWDCYPRNMCKWRAIGFCADVVAPDVTAGLTALLTRPEQFGGTITEAGDFVEGVVTQLPTSLETMLDAALTDLLNNFGADDILRVNDGILPETLEEVERIATMLTVAAEV